MEKINISWWVDKDTNNSIVEKRFKDDLIKALEPIDNQKERNKKFIKEIGNYIKSLWKNRKAWKDILETIFENKDISQEERYKLVCKYIDKFELNNDAAKILIEKKHSLLLVDNLSKFKWLDNVTFITLIWDFRDKLLNHLDSFEWFDKSCAKYAVMVVDPYVYLNREIAIKLCNWWFLEMVAGNIEKFVNLNNDDYTVIALKMLDDLEHCSLNWLSHFKYIDQLVIDKLIKLWYNSLAEDFIKCNKNV